MEPSPLKEESLKKLSGQEPKAEEKSPKSNDDFVSMHPSQPTEDAVSPDKSMEAESPEPTQKSMQIMNSEIRLNESNID